MNYTNDIPPQIKAAKEKLLSVPAIKDLYIKFYNFVLTSEHKRHAAAATSMNKNMKNPNMSVKVFTLEEFEQVFFKTPIGEIAILYYFCCDTPLFVHNDKVQDCITRSQNSEQSMLEAVHEYRRMHALSKREDLAFGDIENTAFQAKILYCTELIDIIINEYEAGNIVLDDQKKIINEIVQIKQKGMSHFPSFPSIFNLVYNLGSQNRLKPQEFLSSSLFSKDGVMEIKSDSIMTIEQAKKKLNGTTQEIFTYLTSYALSQGYQDEITIQVDDYLNARGLERQTKNIKKIIEDLNILSNVYFTLETEYYKHEPGKKKKKKTEITPPSQLITYTLGYVGDKKGKLEYIQIRFGIWMRQLKKADTETGKSVFTVIPFKEDAFKIDQKKHPTAFSYGIKIMERWRFNQQNRINKEFTTEKIRLTTLLDASGELENFPKQAKKRGFVGTRGVLEKVENNLEIAREAFDFQWEWEGGEPPTKLSQLEQAAIVYTLPWWENKKKEKSAK